MVRRYAEAISEEQRVDYAVQAILLKGESESTHSKLNKALDENKELKKRYINLKDDFDALISINKRFVKGEEGKKRYIQ